MRRFGPSESEGRYWRLRDEVKDYAESRLRQMAREEKYYPIRALVYINDGLEVGIDTTGLVEWYSFIVNPSEDDSFIAADVRTAEGIEVGTSLREITRTYGSPDSEYSQDVSILSLGYDSIGRYRYNTNDTSLVFEFRDGQLYSMQVKALVPE